MDKKKLIRFALGSAVTVGLLFVADKTLEVTEVDYSNCIYEINYPDGNGGTIKRLSTKYANSYFIDGVSQNKFYFVPLNESDTIFFVGDGETWNMRRLDCD